VDEIVRRLSSVAPPDVVRIIADQIKQISQSRTGGILTVAFLFTLWSSSNALVSMITTLNTAYDITEGRPWWKTRLTAIALTVGLALFILVSMTLIIAGPSLAERVASAFGLGDAFEWAWKIGQWPIVFVLVATAIALVYYFGPDAEQDWVWITPGSTLATLLWVAVSLGLKLYLSLAASYNETYGAIGGVMILLLWFYLSGLVILIGGELNAEIEHASPYGKEPGEKIPGEKKKIGSLAERLWNEAKASGTFRPAFANENCDLDHEVTPAPTGDRTPRASDWILGGVPLVAATVITFAKLWKRLQSRPAASFRYIGPERRRLPRAS
jgi:membrane protein